MPRQMNLQSGIGLAIGAVILSCSLLTALALAEVAKHQILQLAKAHVEQVGLQMARELSSGMDHLAREIATQSTRDLFRDRSTSNDILRAELGAIQKTRPEFTHLSLIDPESERIVVATGGVFEGGLVRGRPVLVKGKQGIFVGDVHDAVLLASLLPAPSNGEPLRFLDVAAPVINASGGLVGVLAAHVSWEWAGSIRDAILKSQRAQAEILIQDSTGKVVLSSGPGLPLGAAMSTLLPGGMPAEPSVVAWSDKAEYVTAMVSTRPNGYFPEFGWKIVVRQPLDDALGALDRLRSWFVAGALLLGVTGAMLAWQLAARILQPLNRLSDSAPKWAAGESLPESVPTSFGDIARMQDAFDRMAADGRTHSNDASLRESQFVAFADLIPHLVWQSDTDGRIEYVNRQWETTLGAAEGLLLDNLRAVLHPDDASHFAQAWHHSRATGADLMANIRLSRPGHAAYRWYRMWGRPVTGQDGIVSRWVGTATDIDDTMKEQERVDLALRDERQAREEAERVTRMKDEFLATLSHELRTPLNAIAGWSEVLSHRNDLNPIVSKAAEVILRNVGVQASLINDLLDMSAVVAGKVTLDLTHIDAADAVAEIVQSLQTTAQKKKVTLTLGELVRPATVLVDSQRLSQILTNLLSNAIKFTDPGGQIVVKTSLNDNVVCIEVTDNGCGIAPAFLPYVFDRFRQEDGSPTRKRGGMGLGLAIAKSLAELQGGTLLAASDGIGAGSTFRLMLPLAVGGGIQQSAAVPSVLPLEGFSILVADDERDARDAAAALLSALGAHVVTTASAAQVLATLTEERFDCLICDIAMPGMDGHALIAEIRSSDDAALAQLPAVALSAYAMRQDRIAALEAGFQAHVAKPVSMRRLLHALRVAMPQLAADVTEGADV